MTTVDESETDDQYGAFAAPLNNHHEHHLSVWQMIDLFLNFICEMSSNFARSLNKLLQDFGVYPMFQEVSRLLAGHPVLTTCLIVIVLCFALPFIIFFAFTIATIIMAIVGFVVIEGTFITIGTILMLAFFGSISVVLVFFGLVALGGYCGLLHVYEAWMSSNVRLENGIRRR